MSAFLSSLGTLSRPRETRPSVTRRGFRSRGCTSNSIGDKERRPPRRRTGSHQRVPTRGRVTTRGRMQPVRRLTPHRQGGNTRKQTTPRQRRMQHAACGWENERAQGMCSEPCPPLRSPPGNTDRQDRFATPLRCVQSAEAVPLPTLSPEVKAHLGAIVILSVQIVSLGVATKTAHFTRFGGLAFSRVSSVLCVVEPLRRLERGGARNYVGHYHYDNSKCSSTTPSLHLLLVDPFCFSSCCTCCTAAVPAVLCCTKIMLYRLLYQLYQLYH